MVSFNIFEKKNYYTRQKEIFGEVFDEDNGVLKNFEIFDEDDLPQNNNKDILKYILEEFPFISEVDEMMYRIRNNCQNVKINDIVVEWDEIKEIVEKYCNSKKI